MRSGEPRDGSGLCSACPQPGAVLGTGSLGATWLYRTQWSPVPTEARERTVSRSDCLRERTRGAAGTGAGTPCGAEAARHDRGAARAGKCMAKALWHGLSRWSEAPPPWTGASSPAESEHVFKDRPPSTQSPQQSSKFLPREIITLENIARRG